MLPSGSTKLYYRSEGQIILRPHLITSKELRCDTFTPYVTQWCYTYVYGDDDNDEYCNNINSSKLYWCLSLIIGINLVTYMQTHTHTHIYINTKMHIYMRIGKFLSAQALEYTLLQHCGERSASALGRFSHGKLISYNCVSKQLFVLFISKLKVNRASFTQGVRSGIIICDTRRYIACWVFRDVSEEHKRASAKVKILNKDSNVPYTCRCCSLSSCEQLVSGKD